MTKRTRQQLIVLLDALEDTRNADRPDTPYIILRELIKVLLEDTDDEET